MSRKVKILSWSGINYPNSQEEIIGYLEKQLAESEKLHPDLICFTEESLLSKGDGDNQNWAQNNRRALEVMVKGARELHSYIAVNLEEPSLKYPGRSYNTTYLIDRTGKVIGKYRKMYITFRAIGGHGLRGEKPIVCDTDFGRIGFLTCFDANWREIWQELKDKGAELIVFPSAYDGGALLNGYAAVHMYHVVTSVWGNGPAVCRVINPLGEDECVSTGVDDLAEVTVDLDTGYFHTDHNLPKLGRLRRELGDRIHIKTCGRLNMISITSDDPAWPMERIIQEFELLTYQRYIEQSTEDNRIHSQQFPEEELFFESCF